MNPQEIARILNEYSSKLAEIIDYVTTKASPEEVRKIAEELQIKMLPEAEAVLDKMGCEPFRRLLYACGLLAKLLFRTMAKSAKDNEDSMRKAIALFASIWSTFITYIRTTAGEKVAAEIESMTFPELLELMFYEMLPKLCTES